jgi:DNA invertase Pin-like site-specific DNA recombinase
VSELPSLDLVFDVVLQLLSFVAQNERDNTHRRQAEGITAARLRGVQFGRPPKRPPDNFPELVKRWEQGKIKTAEVLKVCGICRSTFYVKLKEYKLKNCPKR